MRRVEKLPPEEIVKLNVKRLWSLRNGRGDFSIENRYRAIDQCEAVIAKARAKCH